MNNATEGSVVLLLCKCAREDVLRVALGKRQAIKLLPYTFVPFRPICKALY